MHGLWQALSQEEVGWQTGDKSENARSLVLTGTLVPGTFAC